MYVGSIILLSLQRLAQSSDMADELLDKLQRGLCRKGLSYKDLPETEVLLFGAIGTWLHNLSRPYAVKETVRRNATRRRQSASL